MREVFIPEIGHEWGSFDYSQQEPRIVVHFAIKHKCKKTSELKKQYDRGEADFHQIVAQMANISRTQAKTINLGLFYGMGKNKLQNELGLKPEQASELFESYHKKVPFVKEISEKFMQFSTNEKLIYTLEDRFCRFDRYETTAKKWNKDKKIWQEWDSDKLEHVPVKLLTEVEAKSKAAELYNKTEDTKWEELSLEEQKKEFTEFFVPAFTYKTLNRMVQGSAADMTKKAMVLLYEKGIVPHIQIHDELCVSIKNKEQALLVKNVMEKAIILEIDNKVDSVIGPNWGSIK
tara:strand:+ start:235 stop:1104 length:870 start_codon:yes stop_codon:yes gene_type:complete